MPSILQKTGKESNFKERPLCSKFLFDTLFTIPNNSSMSTQSYEVEIKSLLGSKENADALKKRLFELDPHTTLVSTNKQLNHYFVGGDLKKVFENVGPLLKPEERTRLESLLQNIKDFSLRTRNKDGEVIFVLKISMNDETSANGVKRLEFEATIPDLSLEELDKKILDAGFSYEAKWSREREEYKYKDTTVTIDKNAGYGYLSEFELMESDENKIHEAKDRLLALMKELGVEELDQARLARMFDYYNTHWAEYYGTDKVFEVL